MKSKPKILLAIAPDNINTQYFPTPLSTVFIVISELGLFCATYLSHVGFALNVKMLDSFIIIFCLCVLKLSGINHLLFINFMDLTVNARVPYISFRNLPRGHSNICKYKTHLFSNSITLI